MIIIGAGCMVFAQAMPLMIVATLLVGLGTGADLPVSLATIAEAAPETKRGKMIAFSQVLWLLGSIIPGFASAAVGGLGLLGGQILFAHVGVVALLVFVARVGIPESTVWKAARSRQETALTALPGTASSLMKAPYFAPFLGLLVFFALLTAGGNTLGQYGTYILVNVAKVPVEVAGVSGLIAVPAALGGAFLFMRIIGSRFRFAFFTVGAVMTSVGALLPAIFGVTLPVYLTALVLFSLGGAFAGDSIMKFWAQRSFPTLLRTTAQGAVISIGRFAGAAFAFAVPAIIAVDARLLFAAIAALLFAGFATAWVVFHRRDRHDELSDEVDILASIGALVGPEAEPTPHA